VWLFVSPIALAFRLTGESRLVGQLWAALFGAGTAALTAWLALQVTTRRSALAAGLLVALFPSQVLWSSLVLRESLVWFALAVVAAALALATKARGRQLLAPAALAAGALAALGLLREQTLVAAALALAVSAVVVPARQRLRCAAGGVTIAAVLPLVMGVGVFGLGLVDRVAPSLEERRVALAAGADTALTESRSTPDDTPPEPVGLGPSIVAVTLRPFPWEPASSAGVGFARIEGLLWLSLYVAALAGVVTARWAWRVLAFPFFVTGALLAMSALSQGNLGTAFRHRGQVAWALVVMVAAASEALRRGRARAQAFEGAVGERAVDCNSD